MNKERILKFENITNFRDVGGYTTQYGRSVKWGKLYRSGNFSKATISDLEQLDVLGLSKVIDFRSEMEKTHSPNRLPNALQDKVVEIPITDQQNVDMIRSLHEGFTTGIFMTDEFSYHQFMIETYERFVIDYLPEFSKFFREILANKGAPLVWHCTAGKDRTGVAGVYVLMSLGVDRETAIQDYLLSVKFADSWLHFMTKMTKRIGWKAANKFQGMRLVQREWIEKALQLIEQEWGDFETFRRDGLGVNDTEMEQLKAWYLE